MGSRLYVGNLSYSTTEDKLRAAFGAYGTLASAAIMLDRVSGRSRGFGFVEYADETNARRAIEALNGAEMDGRALTVNEARARSEGGRGAPRPHRAHPMGDAGGDLGGPHLSDRGGRSRRTGDRERRRSDDNDW